MNYSRYNTKDAMTYLLSEIARTQKHIDEIEMRQPAGPLSLEDEFLAAMDADDLQILRNWQDFCQYKLDEFTSKTA